MDTSRSDQHHIRWYGLVLALIVIIMAAIFLSLSAAAIQIKEAPSSVDSSITKVCNSGAGVAQATWLADPSKSNSTTISVPYGTKNVTIGIYGVRYKCKSSSTAGGWSYIVDPSVSGGGSISGLAGFKYDMKYPAKAGTYNWGKKGSFTYTNNAGMTATKTIKIKMYSAGSLYGGTHPANPGDCADAKNSGHYYQLSKTEKCNAEESTVSLTIKVLSFNNTASSTVSAGTALPGATVKFAHTVTNTGDLNMGKKLTAYAEWTSGGSGKVKDCDVSAGLNAGASNNGCNNNFTIPANAIAGTKYCQRVVAAPRSSGNSGSVASVPACVVVKAQTGYVLTPAVDISQTVVDPGEVVTATPNVTNSGPSNSKTTDWRLYQLVFAPGISPGPNGGASGSDACGYFTSSSNCAELTSGSAIFKASPSQTVLAGKDATVDNLAVGSRVCFVLSLKPWRSARTSNWRHSDLACAVVAKKPKVHILDGDLKVRGDITTSTSTLDGKMYGSWVDYGVFSTGVNQLAASGAGLNGGSTNTQTYWSKLTFANDSSTLGKFALSSLTSAHDYFANLPSTSAGTSTIVLSGTGRKVIDAGNANVIVRASSAISPGGTFIVRTTGMVTIDSDITYDTTAPISKLKDVPQVIIVANDIDITHDVQRVDAWLLASGTVHTCSDGPSGNLTINDCKLPLEVNGPVSANAISLRRTAGATSGDPNAPAETFRLTPYSYLWLRSIIAQSDVVQTTYLTELPPRF